MAGPTSVTVSDDHDTHPADASGHGHEHTVHTGRRPIGSGYIAVMILLLAAIAFYLSFAIPEFTGIVGGPPLAAG